MAKIRGQIIKGGRTTFDQMYQKFVDLDPNQLMMGNANKVWRSLIVYNRNKAGNLKDDTVGKKGKDPAEGQSVKAKRTNREKAISHGLKITHDDGTISILDGNLPDTGVTKAIEEANKIRRGKPQNKVIIYNLTASPYQYIELQNRPPLVDFKGETTWASVKSMGRNTPMYHYTGAEDVLQFNVSWFRTDQAHPDEVINKCRVLEAWSKANGYKAAPPILMIQWGGDSNDNLFDDQLFILMSATYTLKNFSDTSRAWDSDKKTNSNNLIDNKLYPTVATQELIFRRVSATNLEYADILSTEKFNRTTGIV